MERSHDQANPPIEHRRTQRYQRRRIRYWPTVFAEDSDKTDIRSEAHGHNDFDDIDDVNDIFVPERLI
ncbi:MAG: hypothetical protein Q7N95_08380 [Alphaproteobacteria bacterium]|nr:hypothetical protein [Alphaproteobacteria bacterium]